jgi:ABC-type antimicrobial peptide transport system permease subunit
MRVLEEGLADFGFDAGTTRDRLAAFHRVENTYLSTFQSLGGLGLILGTIGLAAVLLRNVLERRQELALLQAVGYRKIDLAGMVVAENGVLLVLGLTAGTSCALLAILPAWMSRGQGFPLLMLTLTLAGVVFVGLGSSLVAVFAAFRSPLLPSLRSE